MGPQISPRQYVIANSVPPLPPAAVVRYKFPSVRWTSPPVGDSPSVQPLWGQKLYSVVNVPLEVILKIVPQP